MRIAVTGSSGLIGRALTNQLEQSGHSISAIDIVGVATACDITDRELLENSLHNCDGIVHLAAVSRVAEAQEFPGRTWATNVDGTQNILNSILNRKKTDRPWLIHASSREVYGDQSATPINEDTPVAPLNIYGRSKAACEGLVACAQDAGATISVLRFANVYGDIYDYSDRVVPAFSRAAAQGAPLRVDDAQTCMDFTHVDDVAVGINKVVECLSAGEQLPPIHFATGSGTTLGTLAQLAVKASNNTCVVNEVERRKSSVSCFIGDPSRARELLGWEHTTPLEDGFSRMVSAFKNTA
ncbi:hypothetical protein AB833_03850 [Chromatiales bacterium (ex Bugula neritina AB1)]|nr:hypothetical protein AB833_03850 [Chromatiales bacterium (ex Bugula neritina AB1)]